jgi:hypothetical protein
MDGMSRRAAIALLSALMFAPAVALAHPGHGEKVVYSGQVLTINPSRVELEIFDKAALATRRVWVTVDPQTVVRDGKAKLTISALRVGQKVDFAGETDEDPDGKPLVRAVTFRVKSK